MFIRAVHKKDRKKENTYTYYRLTHSYRVGNKTRQVVVLNLGKLDGLDKKFHKPLANRIEEILSGVSNTLFNTLPSEVETLAQRFSSQISREKIFPFNKGKAISKDLDSNFQNVDLETMEQIESRSIGGEWLVRQAFDTLGIPALLEQIGLDKKQTEVAQQLLTAKLIHPSSELESERWLNEDSAASELYSPQTKATRYLLYQVATKMYAHKDTLDNLLYSNVRTLFSGQSKIVIYDLTNMYFEGQMLGSEKANFGRSKQKRNDRKLIGLALSIDGLGFVRSSQFYTGNVSEPATFIDLVEKLSAQLTNSEEKPLVIMDAGISTEDNLAILKSEKYNYDYVCVSRTLPKNYDKLSKKAETIEDNRGNKIHLTKVAVEGKDDHFLHVKSDQKEVKEIAMDKKLSQRLEAQLLEIKEKLPKKGTLKKISKIHEKVGGIKAQLSRIGYLYNIEYTEDKEKGIVTDITWTRIKEKEKPKGQYFLRYTNKAINESEIWQTYNLTRDVEAVFRCLKTDLDVRPIYHQKDKYIEPHIWLSILSYQVVNFLRIKLKDSGINDSWTTIVQKMNSMQSSIVTVNNDKQENIYVKLCTRPSVYQKQVFSALNFKQRPFTRKTKVVTQM